MTRVSPQKRRSHVRASLVLTLLESVRDRDYPSELLEDENLSATLPRRLGLSGVIDEQIRRYRQQDRRRVPAGDFAGFVKLIARRPDAGGVFFEVGRGLSPARGTRLMGRWLGAHGAKVVRARVRRRLRAFFGRRFLSSARGARPLEVTTRLLVDADPRGRACSLVTGLLQGTIERAGLEASARHLTCMARGEGVCSWDIETIRATTDSEGPHDGACPYKAGNPLSRSPRE